MPDAKKNIRSQSETALKAFLKEHGHPEFRYKQISHWLWQKSVKDFSAMKNLGAKLIESLEAHWYIDGIKENTRQVSEDGTIKFRFELADGAMIESVMIPVAEKKRFTVCVSSQVGCSLNCSFCATGKMKRMRNLSPGEIVDQVFEVNKACLEIYDAPLTNIVYMGMGEPLLNYKNVSSSIDIISSPEGLHMSSKRITISTAGIAKMIKKLADDHVKCNLALSLHAATEDKRSEIMPINDQNDLASLMEALQYYYLKTKNRISYEYIAFDGFNDGIDDAVALEKLCKKFPVRINIIEYNPVMGVSFEKASVDRIDAFAKYLVERGIMVTVRRSRGKDIDAACGQLANKA